MWKKPLWCGRRQTHDSRGAHPAGERLSASLERSPAWPADTPGGRYYAEFDGQAPVTREGRLIFFAQFPHSGGRWERLLRGCPLRCHGNRGSAVVDAPGTAALSILCGHWRYGHINAVRGDPLNPPLPGMARAVGEDAVRRAMKRIDEPTGVAWLAGELRDCAAPRPEPAAEPRHPTAPSNRFAATSKARSQALSGAEWDRLQPAQAGTFPAACHHSCFMASTRMCLGVEVCGGKDRAAKHGLPRTMGTAGCAAAPPPARLPARRLRLWKNEALLCAAEAHDLPCLCKLRHTAKVKTLLRQIQRAPFGCAQGTRGAAWQDAGDGWEVIEATLRLSGWSRARRVALVREVPAPAPGSPARPASLFPSASSVGANARRRCGRMQPALSGSADWGGKAPPRGPAKSPCPSPRPARAPTPPSRWPGSTAEEAGGTSGGWRAGGPNAPTRRTSMTNSKTNGAGPAMPPKSSPPAG